MNYDIIIIYNTSNSITLSSCLKAVGQYEMFFLGVSEKRRCSEVPLLLESNLSNQWGLSQISAIQKLSSEILLRRTAF